MEKKEFTIATLSALSLAGAFPAGANATTAPHSTVTMDSHGRVLISGGDISQFLSEVQKDNSLSLVKTSDNGVECCGGGGGGTKPPTRPTKPIA